MTISITKDLRIWCILSSLNEESGTGMRKLQRKVKENPHLALSVPTVLCAITFVTNFIAALKDDSINNSEMHQLLANASAFETVILFVLMFVLKNKKK